MLIALHGCIAIPGPPDNSHTVALGGVLPWIPAYANQSGGLVVTESTDLNSQ